MRDLANNIDVKQSIAPALRTSTVTGTEADRLGFESVAFLVHVGAWTNGSFALSVEESDDNVSWGAAAAGDIIGTAPTIASLGGSPSVPNIENDTVVFGYRGAARYVRPVVTVTGSPNIGAFVGVSVLLGHPRNAPVA
jgi:hypothetical protein